MEKIFLHKVRVQVAAQAISFRIYLPRDLYQITGIMVTENTYLNGSDPNTNPDKSQVLTDNLSVGRLYLKERGYTNKFFSTDVISNDNSLKYGDFQKLDFFQTPEPLLQDFYLSDWFLAGSKWEYFPAEVKPCSNILLGFFRDNFGNYAGGKIDAYTITIYLKYETKPCGRN